MKHEVCPIVRLHDTSSGRNCPCQIRTHLIACVSGFQKLETERDFVLRLGPRGVLRSQRVARKKSRLCYLTPSTLTPVTLCPIVRPRIDPQMLHIGYHTPQQHGHKARDRDLPYSVPGGFLARCPSSALTPSPFLSTRIWSNVLVWLQWFCRCVVAPGLAGICKAALHSLASHANLSRACMGRFGVNRAGFSQIFCLSALLEGVCIPCITCIHTAIALKIEFWAAE